MLVSNHLSPNWLAALGIIKAQAEILRIPFMIIGASARDILLDASSIEPIRATRDVDLAIEVASWVRVDELKEALIKTGAFEPGREMQRLIFDGHLPIDLVPYGAVEQRNSEISWPPDHEILMSVVGMRDAFDSSLTLSLTEAPNLLEINVASATGIVLLKLLAWEDRKSNTTKDAEDLYFLLYHYIDLGNQEHLANNHADLFEDYEVAHARLLGRDLLKICSSETLSAVNIILDRETDDANKSRLVRDMLPKHAEANQLTNCKHLLLAMRAEMGAL